MTTIFACKLLGPFGHLALSLCRSSDSTDSAGGTPAVATTAAVAGVGSPPLVVGEGDGGLPGREGGASPSSIACRGEPGGGASPGSDGGVCPAPTSNVGSGTAVDGSAAVPPAPSGRGFEAGGGAAVASTPLARVLSTCACALRARVLPALGCRREAEEAGRTATAPTPTLVAVVGRLAEDVEADAVSAPLRWEPMSVLLAASTGKS